MFRTFTKLAAAFGIVFVGAMTDEIRFPRDKPNAKSTPVRLSARQPKTESKVNKIVEISLIIRDEYEIYSERGHEFLMPLKIELLDPGLKDITSNIVYPQPKTIPSDESFGGEYHVYHGRQKFIVSSANTAHPTYVRVSYHGHSKHGY